MRFHELIVNQVANGCDERISGTKCAGHYVLSIPAGESVQLRCRITGHSDQNLAQVESQTNVNSILYKHADLSDRFDEIFRVRIREADAFYNEAISSGLTRTKSLFRDKLTPDSCGPNSFTIMSWTPGSRG